MLIQVQTYEIPCEAADLCRHGVIALSQMINRFAELTYLKSDLTDRIQELSLELEYRESGGLCAGSTKVDVAVGCNTPYQHQTRNLTL
ncbi:hypothetical protein J6590_075911 [Homalodisca vitripennis]|nr:hypothetical protein J6590_075911 [Homalodisca vitripennis]